MSKTALIIVDVQNDFLPSQGERGDGALAVPDGNAVIPVIQGLLNKDKWKWDVIIASQDYHPPSHISFASRHRSNKPFTPLEVTDSRGKKYSQMLWPDHCVQGTKGAEIEKDLRKCFEPWKDKMKIVRKACYKDVEAYSTFEGYLTEATDPDEPPEDPGEKELEDSEMVKCLKEKGVEKVVITGLATDFCINATTLDAIRAKFQTLVLAPSVRGVYPDKSEEALDRVEEEGGKVIGRDVKADWGKDLLEWLQG